MQGADRSRAPNEQNYEQNYNSLIRPNSHALFGICFIASSISSIVTSCL
jgi:hypothetical protein